MLFFADYMVKSSKKKIREGICLQNLVIKRLGNAKIHVDIDPQTSRVIGPNRANFVSYLGVLA